MAPSPRIIRRQPQVDDNLPPEWPEPLRRVFLNRGVGRPDEAETSLKRLLPFKSLKGIDKAAALLQQALREQWCVLFIGDYDADGATATALGVSVLQEMGLLDVDFLVPDRFRYGYGLSPEIVKLAAERKPDLLITVDNGISNIAGTAEARKLGIRVLITDHHLPGAELPDADAIVNPNQPGCDFPSKKLAGVGVIFYVMAALRQRLRDADELQHDINLAHWLDLVALGTVADVVPLDYNNRILVAQGLHRIRTGRPRPGIRELAQIAGRELERLTSTDLAFALAPRLNAAGRLEDMRIGIRCLLTEDAGEALSLAQQLDDLNRARREIQQDMQQQAAQAIEALKISDADLPAALCAHADDWHEGVVGLVAGHLKERYHRPAVAFAPASDSGWLKGSARSIPGFHIRDALDAVAAANPGLIEKFGGHAMAAGLSLKADKLDDFILAFTECAADWLTPAQLEARLSTDGELECGLLTMEIAEALQQAAPWGQHFEAPCFDGRFEVTQGRVVGDKHLKLRLRSASGKTIDAIAFNTPNLDIRDGEVHVAYRLDINEWQGRRSLQFIIEHIESL